MYNKFIERYLTAIDTAESLSELTESNLKEWEMLEKTANKLMFGKILDSAEDYASALQEFTYRLEEVMPKLRQIKETITEMQTRFNKGDE